MSHVVLERVGLVLLLASVLLADKPLTVSGSVPGTGVVGTAYSGSVTASGGSPPYTFSLSSGSLPKGLSLSSKGGISGTPTQAGSSSFSVKVTDDDNHTATGSFTIAISASSTPPLSIGTTSPLPSGTVGSSYSQGLAATGGTPPYRWSGSAPPGLSVGTNGSITGTPSAAGNFSVSATVTDSASVTANRTFAITINAPPLTITTNSPLPAGTVGLPYSQGLAATGGTPPYRWSGPAPPGLSIGPDGSITGTPSTAGSFSVSATVTDNASATASRTFAIAINAPSLPPLTISTNSLPPGTVGMVYSQGLTAAGGTPPYRWSGSAPAGLSLGPDGSITGTPSTAGSFTVSATVTDNASSQASKQFAIAINATTPATLAITTVAVLPNIAIGTQFSQSFNASGGSPPYRWSLSSGSLPAGLSLAPGGLLSGLAGAAGAYSFTVQVIDSASGTVSKSFTLTITSGPAILTDSMLSAASVRVPYTQSVLANGGAPPLTWFLVGGQLPPGLSLNPSTGVISGAGTLAGTFDFTIQVADSSGAKIGKQFTIVVAPGLTISTAPALSGGTVGAAYSETLAAAGGRSPYLWSIGPGSLPSGVALNPSTGVVSGLPTEAGSFTFTAQVKDSSGASAIKQFTITVSRVAPSLAIPTPSSLPNPMVGTTYGFGLSASGGTPPYSWMVIGGALPDGLVLEPSTGTITGVPRTTGPFTVFIQVTDSAGALLVKQFSLNVDAPAVPGLSLGSVPEAVDAAQQLTLDLNLDNTYPLPVTGEIRLRFLPDAAIGADDPAIQFSNGGRVVTFTIAANSTRPDSQIALQTGTVAGTIELNVTLQGGLGVNRSITISRLAPSIRNLRMVRTPAGFELRVTGFSNTREMVNATVRFAGASLQTTEVVIPLNELARSWYQSNASRPFGSQFSLSLPFSIQGSFSAIQSATLVVTNAVGSSAPVSIDFGP